MAMEKTPMPEQAPDIRNKNFKEVTLGYTRRWPSTRLSAVSTVKICPAWPDVQ